MGGRRQRAALLLGACLFGFAALDAVAQPPPTPVGEAPLIAEEVEVETDEDLDDEEGSWADLSVNARGGVAALTGGLAVVTAPGPTWGVLVDSEPFESLSFEFGWDGSRFPLVDPRLEGVGVWRNAFTGLVKLETSVGIVEPFVGSGVGVSYWNPGDEAEPFYSTDLVAELPVTLGLDFDAGPIDAGIRGSVRGLIGTGFSEDVDPENRSGTLLSTSLTVGGEF